MTSTPPMPKRRRWRWLVAGACLLCLAAGVGAWWFWPVGDARFVGSWASQKGGNGYWEFRRNGIAVCHMTSPTSAIPLAAYTTWQVKDNILLLGNPSLSTSQNWRAWMLHQWNNVLPFDKWIVANVSFRIVEVGPDKLVLLSTDFQVPEDEIRPEDTETLDRIRP